MTLDETRKGMAAVKNAGQVMDLLFKHKTVQEVENFMQVYREVTPHADDNINTMLGYCSDEQQRTYWALLQGKEPNRFDGMDRKALIARIAELESQ